MNKAIKSYRTSMSIGAPNYVGKFVSIKDSSGLEWFRGRVLEHIEGSTFRFQVFMIGGRLLEAQMIADIRDIAVAAITEATAL